MPFDIWERESSPCVGCEDREQDKNQYAECLKCEKIANFQSGRIPKVEIEQNKPKLVKTGIKYCSRCNIEKPLSEFYKTVLSRGGKKDCCKTCDNKRRTEHNHKYQFGYLKRLFKDNPELYEITVKTAAEQFRTIEQQILFWIQKGACKPDQSK